ncbi:MAG: carbamoyltransferase [Leptospirillia bacterium]
MLIIGINAYHGDSSACVIKDGNLLAAAEEERFRRVKHWAGFPSESIRYCLQEAGASLAEVDWLAINTDPRANLWQKLLYTVKQRPGLDLILGRLRNMGQRLSVEERLQNDFPGERFGGQVAQVEHHLCHLASGFLVSPFESAVTVSVDGFGDFSSAAWGLGSGTGITVDGRVMFPHSLGIFYQAITQYLGFPHYGDEYKVMGLAPYGEDRFAREMGQIVTLEDDGGFKLNLDYFRHHREKVTYEWTGGSPEVGTLFSPQLESLLGPARAPGDELTQTHRDMARSAQAMYERAFFHLLNVLHRRYRVDRLALSGGCAMNSVANGRIYANSPFRQVYVQAAAGDAGGAIGAAMTTWHRQSNAPRGEAMSHAYWGPQASDAEVDALLIERKPELESANCRVSRIEDEQELCARTAQAISEGKVIGWFQGRMEWGPRALGNRSILGDPRRADMKDILNLKIKRRESFRPFAPSILRDAVPDWFETEDDVPFMTHVFQVREDRRAQIPAVTHADGSGRLQTVTPAGNARYATLIQAFADLTGVPVLLNTSFNENEPVVCQPSEALDCFLRTHMDVLVLGNHFIER